jgi:hypothetical protein
MTALTSWELRDYLIRAHALAIGNYVQSDAEIRKRIGDLLEMAISSDDIMRGFLGRGGPEADRDLITGTGSLGERQHE